MKIKFKELRRSFEADYSSAQLVVLPRPVAQHRLDTEAEIYL